MLLGNAACGYGFFDEVGIQPRLCIILDFSNRLPDGNYGTSDRFSKYDPVAFATTQKTGLNKALPRIDNGRGEGSRCPAKHHASVSSNRSRRRTIYEIATCSYRLVLFRSRQDARRAKARPRARRLSTPMFQFGHDANAV